MPYTGLGITVSALPVASRTVPAGAFAQIRRDWSVPLLLDDGQLGSVSSCFGVPLSVGERVLLAGGIYGRRLVGTVISAHQSRRLAWMDRVGPWIGGLVMLGSLAAAALAAILGS